MASLQPRKRNRTRQRERMLDWLRNTDTHPTAAEIHTALLGEFPRLSLGTVYRNLDVLVGQGVIEPVPSAAGALRYDGNPTPHNHFLCEHCGEIRDLELSAPASLARRLDREFGLRAQRVRIEFYGRCPSCAADPTHPAAPEGGNGRD